MWRRPRCFHGRRRWPAGCHLRLAPVARGVVSSVARTRPAVDRTPHPLAAAPAVCRPRAGSRSRRWTVSRVLFRRAVAPSPARIIHLGDALLRRSSALTRTSASSDAGAGRPKRRLYSSLHREGLAPPPVTRLSRVGSYPTFSPLPSPPPAAGPKAARASSAKAVSFLWRFPSGRPGSPLATSRALRCPDFPPAGGVCPPAIPRPPPARVEPTRRRAPPPSAAGVSS